MSVYNSAETLSERLAERIPALCRYAFGVTLLLAFAVTVLPPYPPLQDYLEWVYHGVLVDQLMLNGGEGSVVALRDYPVPNTFAQALLALFVRITNPALAAKIVMGGYLLLSFLIYRALRKLGPAETSAPAMMVIFSVMVGSQFFNGYANNLFGNLFLLLYVAIILRRKPLILETLAFSFLIFFCHATSFMVFGMVVVIHVLWRAFRWQHLIALVPTGLMFLWYTAAKDHYVEEGLVLSGFRDWLEYKVYSVMKLGPYQNIFTDGASDYERFRPFFFFGILANAAFAAFLGVLVLQVFVRNRLTWLRDPAWVSVAVILIAYPLMPATVSGVVNIGERFLTIAVTLMVAIAVMGPLKWTLSVGAAISTIVMLSLVSLGYHSATTRTWRIPEDVVATIPSDGSGRLSRLFWHRPFQFAGRIEDIERVRAIGPAAAVPLDFTTSIIGPARPAPSDGQDTDTATASGDAG